jgi:hypothetical protein
MISMSLLRSQETWQPAVPGNWRTVERRENVLLIQYEVVRS